MKNTKYTFFCIFAAVLGFSSCQKEQDSTTPGGGSVQSSGQELNLVTYDNGELIPGQYIVVLNDDVVPADKSLLTFGEGQSFVKSVATEMFSKNSITQKDLIQTYAHSVNGFAVQLSEDEVSKLLLDKRVKYIEQDQFISLGNPGKGNGGGGGSTTPPPQTTPWGIAAVGGAGNGASSGKKAWIIDSGIDLDHPDLTVDVANSTSFLSGKGGSSADDENGHGTHVAGIIGALDNSIGVIGVAAGVPVVAVRVLDRRGSGTISGVIAGVNYVASVAAEGDVANMSLGGGVSATLDNAVAAAASNGIQFVIAAGNSSTDANTSSPARVNGSNIYTISAMDVNSLWAYFSNYGNPPIDYCAPGVSIYSCYKGQSYATLSGTSMAAPHVAGILILGNVYSYSTVLGDPDGSPDPIAHR